MTENGITLIVVPRSDLIAHTEETLRLARVDPDSKIAQDVLGVAKTAEYVSADWGGDEEYWEGLGFYGKCGCLIGTLNLKYGNNPHPKTPEEDSIGMAFYNVLKEHYAESNRDGYSYLPDDLILHVLDVPATQAQV